MPFYAVQDSDWDWAQADGDAVIVEADNPEEAASKAVAKWLEVDAHAFDGAQLKVAPINLMGIIGCECTDDGVQFDGFQYIPRGDPAAPPLLTLGTWFGLSYSSWLTMPRVMMEAMPEEWQQRMADLLYEYDAAFPNNPDIYSQVNILVAGKQWLLNYRHPDREKINECRAQARDDATAN